MASEANTERNVFVFTWKIENFIHFKVINSPVFFAAVEANRFAAIDCEFSLELICRDYQFEKSMIGLYLHLAHEYRLPIELDFELSCLALDGSALTSRKKLKFGFKGRKCRGFWNFMPLDDVITKRRKEFLPHGTLTLQCKIWKTYGNMSESVLCFARSRVGIEQSSFVWPIERFSCIMEGDTTAPYSVRKVSQGDPPLSMNFHMDKPSSKGTYFEVQLTQPDNVHKTDSEKNTRGKIGFYDLKLSFVNASGEEKLAQDMKRLQYDEMVSLLVLITEELMKKENGYIVDDVLSLKCQFTFYEGIVSEEIERTVFGSREISDFRNSPAVVLQHDDMNTSISSLKDIHKFLYDSKKFCDVELRSGTECIPAHKSILSARSLVFQSQFEKSKEDIVEVNDVTAEVLRQMILYIYTDTVNDMPIEDTNKLFVAAEKYKVSSLKKRCAFMLIENLNNSNVCEMLHFNDEHEDEDLKSAIQDFIFNHGKEVTDSAEWKILVQQNAAIAEKINSLLSKERDC